MFICFSSISLLLVTVFYNGSFAALREGDKCSLKDGSEGICKFLKECPTAVELIRTDVNPVICGLEEIELIVCCKDDENITKIADTTMAVKRVSRRTEGDISRQKCNEYAEYAYEKIISPTLLLKPHFTKKLVCEYPRGKLTVGTSKALRRQFPHMALIGYKPHDELIWACGGSLISENFVLTAARCIVLRIGPPELVRLGSANKSDLSHMQERTVKETIVHYKFSYSSPYHDIGLIKLSRRMEFNTYVRPACLHIEKSIPYDLAIASGWGIYEYTDDLLEIVFQLFNASKCNSAYYRGDSRRQTRLVDDLIICAGSTSVGGKDSCTGDVGGPLQVYHEETEETKCMYDVIGVIAFGRSCGLERDTPHVFARVSGYIKWIEDIVWPN